MAKSSFRTCHFNVLTSILLFLILVSSPLVLTLIALTSPKSLSDRGLSYGIPLSDDDRDIQAGQAEADWPLFGHDARRTGFYPGSAQISDNAIWISNSGGGETSSVIFNGKVYGSSKSASVVCYDAFTGLEIWRLEGAGHDGWVAYAYGKLYVGMGGWGASVRCLDPNSGRTLWVNDQLNYYSGHELAAYDGNLFFSVGCGLYCLDADTGSIRWYYEGNSNKIAVSGGRVFVTQPGLLCLDAETGGELWRFDYDQSRGDYVNALCTPSVDDGRVFIYDYKGYVYCLDAGSGHVIWMTSLPNPGTSILQDSFLPVAYGCVFVPQHADLGDENTPGIVYCLDAGDGSIKWSFRTDEIASGIMCAVADGKLFLVTRSPNIYCIDAFTGEKVWKYVSEVGDYYTSLAIAEGNLYASCGLGGILCLGKSAPTPPQPPPSGVEISSSWLTTEVSIDGKMSSGEWSDATAMHITSGYSVNFEYYLYIKNDDNWIFVCLDVVGDASQHSDDYAFIAFDTGNDGLLTHEREDGIAVFGDGSVGHILYNEDSENWGLAHCWSNWATAFTGQDRDETGMVAALGFASSQNSAYEHNIYEFKIPMALGDLNAYPGDKIRLYMEILDQNAETFSLWPSDCIWKDLTTWAEVVLATSGPAPPTQPPTQQPTGGGCVIATATYGSELAPEVCFLREFRDKIVLRTFLGSCFMKAFNAWYYSFSPKLASLISRSLLLRGFMRFLLYPLIGIMHVSALTYQTFSFNQEFGVLIAGFVASFLIGITYLSPLLLLLLKLKKYHKKAAAISVRISKPLIASLVITIALICLGYMLSSSILTIFSTSSFVLLIITLSGIILPIRALELLR